jgi:hypothetical protein
MSARTATLQSRRRLRQRRQSERAAMLALASGRVGGDRRPGAWARERELRELRGVAR